LAFKKIFFDVAKVKIRMPQEIGSIIGLLDCCNFTREQTSADSVLASAQKVCCRFSKFFPF
jgi:hypothetical protein